MKLQKAIEFERIVKLMAGRPAQDVKLDEIKYLLAFNFKIEDIADILGVGRSTLFCHMKAAKIEKYADISDRDLDAILYSIKQQHSNDGEILMQGHLLSQGIRIHPKWLRQSIHCVDPLNTALRRTTTVRRCVYHVEGPNTVWHLDGNHKLIRWRFVIQEQWTGTVE